RSSGTIVGSKEEKLMLSTFDEAYVEFSRKARIAIGQRFTIFRTLKQTTHPKSGERVGTQVEIVGTGQITGKSRQDNVYRVSILEALNPIERGYRVGPLRSQFVLVAPRRNAKRVVGTLIDTFLAETKLAGSDTMVFIDRGAKDGVETGNRFFVVR